MLYLQDGLSASRPHHLPGQVENDHGVDGIVQECPKILPFYIKNSPVNMVRIRHDDFNKTEWK